MAKVVLRFMDKVLGEYPVEGDMLTVGRNPDCDIQIDNPAVSGFHAKIYRDGSRVMIEDTNSSNGTLLNGSRIFKAAMIKGDQVLIGKHTLSFVSEGEGSDAGTDAAQSSLDKTVVLDRQTQEKILSKVPSASTVELTAGFEVIEGTTDRVNYGIDSDMVTIGKGDSALIKLKGLLAPKIAASVLRKEDGYYLTPGGKTVTVNGGSVTNEYLMENGDIVELAGLKLRFYRK